MAVGIPFGDQVENSSGVPVSGAKIYFKIKGTSTNATTYTDSALTIPAANPVIAAADGWFNTYLDPGVNYDVQIKSADDSITYRSFSESPTSTGSQPLDATLTALAGAGFENRKFPRGSGVDTVSNVTIGEALNVYNVRDYGAVGNGTTSDRSAFQSAIDAAFAVNGTVYIPPGTYLIDDELEIGDGSTSGRVRIMGAGMRQTVLYVTPFGASKKLFKGTNPDTDTRPSEWNTFEDFEIQGRNTANDTTFASIDHPIGIYLPYSNCDFIRNVRVRALGGTSFWTSSANNSRIKDCWAFSCGFHYTQDDAASTGATFSLTSGSDQVTATAAVFVADHVGRNFHVEGGSSLGGSVPAAFTIGAVAGDGLSATLDRNAAVTVSGSRGTFEGVRGSITSADQTFTSETAVFRSADVGRYIYIEGAGPNGRVLVTTIASFTSSTVVELTDAAETSVTNEFWYFTPMHYHGVVTADDADSRQLNDIRLDHCLVETSNGVDYIFGPGVNVWLTDAKSHGQGTASVTRAGRNVRNIILDSLRAFTLNGIEIDYGYSKNGGNILICGTESVQSIKNFSAGSMPENQPFIEFSGSDADTILVLGDGHYHKNMANEPDLFNFTGSNIDYDNVISNGKIVTRDDATIYQIGAPSVARAFGSGRAVLADDTAISITPPHYIGQIVVTTSGTTYNATCWFRVGSAPSANIEKLTSGGANVAVGTTALTNGTSDGTDTDMNIAAVSDGKIYLKNRSGISLNVSWTITW